MHDCALCDFIGTAKLPKVRQHTPTRRYPIVSGMVEVSNLKGGIIRVRSNEWWGEQKRNISSLNRYIYDAVPYCGAFLELLLSLV